MSSQPSTKISVEAARIALIAEKLRGVPDTLVVAKINLEPLRTGDQPGVPPETAQTVTHVCDLLAKAIQQVMVALEYIDDWSAERTGDSPQAAD